MFTEITQHLMKFDEKTTLNTIKTLVQNGANVKEGNNIAIRFASYYADFPTFMYFVDNGADIHANENEPFVNAMGKNLSIVRYLVCQGINPHIPLEGHLGSYVTQAVCHIEVLKYLVEDLGVNHRLDNDAAFNSACMQGQLESVKLLYSKGVDINNQEGKPLLFACQSNHTNVIQFLIDHGARLDLNAQSIINTACQKGYLDLLKKLVRYKLKPQINPNSYISAVIGKHIPIISYLITLGADIHGDNGYMLKEADRDDDYSILEFCLGMGLKKDYIEEYATDKIKSYLFSRHLSNVLPQKNTIGKPTKI